MSFVKLQRNWFGPDQKRYRAATGLHEIHDENVLAQVPSDAEVYDGANLPTLTLRPQPGFGAKPLNELIADTIPGAAPSKVLPQNRNAPRVDPASPGEKERLQKSFEAQQRMQGIDAETGLQDRKEEHAAMQASIDKALPIAQRIAEQVQDSTDPVAEASEAAETAPKPKPAPDKDKAEVKK